MNLKVGDKVKIKDNLKEIENFAGSYVSKLEDYVGKISTVRRIEGNMVFLKENDWTWDIRVLEKVFTKSDLQDGDVVTYRNGNKRTIKGNRLINEDGIATNILINYNDDLIQKNVEENSIIKVERPVQHETVFERKEEILDKAEKRWLRNFIKSTGIKVEFIKKWLGASCENEYLEITYSNYWSNNEVLFLPVFKKNTKYKGMEKEKKYTLKELGL